MSKKIAFITGISGQDGSYLAELLLEKGYEVHGMVRRHSVPQNQTNRIQYLYDNNKVTLHYGDMTDPISISNIIKKIRPNEIYSLAAQSHVQVSFEVPQYTQEVNGGGTLSILETVKEHCPDSKIYIACTSEMFGNQIDEDGFQRETTPMVPVSPYGSSKLYAYNISNNYKDSYDMFVCAGILFNHTSIRRPINFVVAKIVYESILVLKGYKQFIELGNLDAKRDIGFAKDYVEGMWLMLQQDKSKNYVLATGKTYSIRNIVEYIFDELGLNMGTNLKINPRYLRPNELYELKGDARKAKKYLGWEPKYSLFDVINDMIEYWGAIYER